MGAEQRVAIITGASQGIGEALVRAYRDRHFGVVANSRAIREPPDADILAVAGDISDSKTAERIVSQAIERFGRVDTLINNAGIFITKPLADYTNEDHASLLGINLDGFFHITRRVAKEMLKRGSGHIVQITTSLDEHAVSSVPSLLAALTKGGLNAATKSLAVEYASKGIPRRHATRRRSTAGTVVGRKLASRVHATFHVICSHRRGVARGDLRRARHHEPDAHRSERRPRRARPPLAVRLQQQPFHPALCAAPIAGIAAAVATHSLRQPSATALVAFCPCMVLVSDPHLLNGAIDLVRTRIALGIARLTYAGVVVLMICFGLLLGFNAGGAPLPAAGPSVPVPLLAERDCSRVRRRLLRHHLLDPLAQAAAPCRSWDARACGTLGTDLARRGECRDRSARGLYSGQHHRHAGRRPSASALCCARIFRGCFDDNRASSYLRQRAPLVELVSRGPRAAVTLLTNIAANGATAFLVILAMTFGLILAPLLLEHFLPPPS
jgi:NADP-dependent 3-hydroxy acid dehydrogenase YdfG